MIVWLWSVTAAASEEIKIGILPRLSKDEMISLFHPPAKHLEKATGQKVKPVIPRDSEDFKKVARSGEVDMAFSNPLIYAQLRKDVNIAPLAHTDYFPNWPLFSTPKLNKDLAARAKAALLKLKPGSAEGGEALGRANLTGFVDVSDKDYDQLRQAAKLAGAL